MEQRYKYEEKAVPFKQKSFQIPESPDQATPKVFIFGNKGSDGRSEMVTIDLKTQMPTHAMKIEKGYSGSIIYNPPTDTLYQPEDGQIIVHHLVKNQVMRLKHGEPSSKTGVPFKCLSRVCGDLVLLLDDQNLVMINTNKTEFSKLEITEKGYENIDLVHTGGNTIAVLARKLTDRSDGMVRVYDIINKELLCMFRMEFKGNSASAISPKIFYNYSKKKGVVYRGAEAGDGETQVIGVSTFDPVSKEVTSQAFKIKAPSYDKPSMVAFSGYSNSLYLGTVTAKVFQIGLTQGGFIGGLGTYNKLQRIATHPLWDGLLLLFKPEQGIMKLGFVSPK